MLIDAYKVDCVLLNRIKTADGFGGFDEAWGGGPVFKAAIRLDSSLEARVAEKQGVTALYTVTTSKSINLQYHEVFRRTTDNKIFRITSDGDDKHTPDDVTSLDMRQVSAEEWRLGKDEDEGSSNN